MALDKAIAAGKEKRDPYYGVKRHVPSCRPGGSCPWCRNNRRHQERKELLRAQVKEDGDAELPARDVARCGDLQCDVDGSGRVGPTAGTRG